MSFTTPVALLCDYTDWQRSCWREWFASEPAALSAFTGPHTDGRFGSIGALIRHIFSAELRYVERLRALPLTDPASIPTDRAAPLFEFGVDSREQLRLLLAFDPASAWWDTPVEMPLLARTVRLAPRKVLLHLVTHEIRHWAQVATTLRWQGWKVPQQDLLFSPIGGPAVSI
ncbi:MAG TPA: DinB family protein [Gemmatimonadales bacterium]|nr:DinB family protein [Gemmatimonadales bacterium]